MVNKLALRFFPFLAWFPISTLILRGDLVAGLTGALVLVPKAMAYAQLSGLPLHFGLYTAFVPAILGALWGSSRQLATGPVAIISLMTAAAVTPLATPYTDEYVGLALLLTLMVGCIQFILGAVKLGIVVNFVSHPVVLGFMNAAAIIIGLSQLDLMLGIPKERSDFFLKDIWDMLSFLPQVHWPTLAMTVFSLALMLVLKKVSVLAKPSVLITVAVTSLLSFMIGYEHNYSGQITEIATPEARELVSNYSRTTQRIDELGKSVIDLSGQARQQEKAGDVRAAAELRHRIELIEFDIRALEAENSKLSRAINQLSFVRGKVGEGETALLYQTGKVPVEVKTDDRRYRVKKIEQGKMKLVAGGEVVGKIPDGLPSFRLPAFSIEGVMQLLTAALIISMVAFMESISMAKAMASMVKQRIDPNQELIGQGLANIGGSFFQAYPSCGSFTGSAINLQAGAKTGFAMVFNGIFVAITLLFLTPLLYHLPKAVLAAIIMMAVIGLINISGFLHAWRAQWYDGLISLLAFLGTLWFAPHLDKGIIIGVVLCLVVFLCKNMRPVVSSLTRDRNRTLVCAVTKGLEECKYLSMIRFEGPLFFANASYLEDKISDLMLCKATLRHVLIVANGINDIDASGEETLSSLVGRLRSADIDVSFSGINETVMKVLVRTHLFEKSALSIFIRPWRMP
jgi:sulfate permease, SulP family